jgi:hypothetical protein
MNIVNVTHYWWRGSVTSNHVANERRVPVLNGIPVNNIGGEVCWGNINSPSSRVLAAIARDGEREALAEQRTGAPQQV